jgi:chromosome segregation ATPase
MNIIRKIALKNFESHEDTVLDNLSPELNAIVGLSNSGKSAIVRALALIAYNQFDPESVRKGSDNCEVQVWTDKGNVKVTRGKKNLWEVTDASGKTSYFDKIGKQILPQVSEILGFGLVKLGDVEMKVNIMDQLESHFMLSEFAGQDATGSLRAQVVDEISGLSGIEMLIREVSLDNSRLTREINQLEEQNEELTSKLHDENLLIEEQRVLNKVQEDMKNYDELKEAVVLVEGLKSELGKEQEKISQLEAELSQYPDEKKAFSFLSSGQTFLNDAESMSKFYKEWQVSEAQAVSLNGELKKLPDNRKALGVVDSGLGKVSRGMDARKFYDQWVILDRDTKSLNVELKLIPNDVAALIKTKHANNFITMVVNMHAFLSLVKTSQEQVEKLTRDLIKFADEKKAWNILEKVPLVLEKAKKMKADLDAWNSVKALEKNALESLNREDESLKKQIKEYEDARSQVDVCPITMKPISGDCLQKD